MRAAEQKVLIEQLMKEGMQWKQKASEAAKKHGEREREREATVASGN